MELTDRYIRALVVDNRREIPDESFRHGKKRRGLVLLAETSGNHKFLYKRMVKGARHNFTLGAYPDLSLAIARERVDDINDYDGSPGEAWQALFAPAEKPEVMTVDRLINNYIGKECEPYNRDWANQQLILKRELQPYLSMPADEMTVDHVLDIVQGCLDRGSPRTAQEALKQVRGMYNWAMGKKRVRRRVVSKEEATQALVRKVIVKMAKNPAEGVIAPEYKARHYHLSGKALSSFTKKLAASNLRDDCKLVLLIQLQTFCRVGEVSGMRWDELNLKKRVWVIPGERYKTGVDHKVILSKQTAKLIRGIPNAGQYVFTMPRRDKPVSARDVAKEINKVRPSLKQHKDFSSHSLRHTGVTWLASEHCPLEVRERLVGHAVDNSDMSQRYQHHKFLDERKDWTQRWCDFLVKK